MSCHTPKSSSWSVNQKELLNLNPGQEVGLYLFPFPALFLLRDWSFEIVHPDNGATVGIVHCIFFSRLCYGFDDCPIKQERGCEVQLAEGEKHRDFDSSFALLP